MPLNNWPDLSCLLDMIQVELHPFYQQRALRAFCADKGIVVQVPLPPPSTLLAPLHGF
jgi:diketogulonate reductase-like aldo/keto reductase